MRWRLPGQGDHRHHFTDQELVAQIEGIFERSPVLEFA